MVPQELIVTVDAGTPPEDSQAIATDFSLDLEEAFVLRSIGREVVRLTVPPGLDTIAFRDLLLLDPRVESAQLNYRYRTLRQSGSDSGQLGQYALTRIKATDASVLATGRNVTIAVIDTGVDTDHRDFAGRSIDVVARDRWSRPRGTLIHGTAMAGAIVASGVIRGVAPETRLLVLPAFEADPQNVDGGISSTDRIARALDEAIQQRVDAINMSFSGAEDRLVSRLVQRAVLEGITVVAAAGGKRHGDHANRAIYPAALPDVIAVTATDEHDRVYSEAGSGDYISLSAPGVDVAVPAPGNKYMRMSGTSIASALVSGVVALIRERHPGAEPRAIKSLLEGTALNLGRPDVYGAGLVDAWDALNSTVSMTQVGQ